MSPPFDKEITSIFIVHRHLSHQFRFTYPKTEWARVKLIDDQLRASPAENTDVSHMNWIAVDACHSDPGHLDPPTSFSRGWPFFISRTELASLRCKIWDKYYRHRAGRDGAYPIEKSPWSLLMKPPTFCGFGTSRFQDSCATDLQTFKINLCPPEDVNS